MEYRGDFLTGVCEPWNDVLGRKPEHPDHVRSGLAEPVRHDLCLFRIPAGFLHGLDQGAGPGFDGVNLRPVSGVSRQAESTAQSRHSTGLPKQYENEPSRRT